MEKRNEQVVCPTVNVTYLMFDKLIKKKTYLEADGKYMKSISFFSNVWFVICTKVKMDTLTLEFNIDESQNHFIPYNTYIYPHHTM